MSTRSRNRGFGRRWLTAGLTTGAAGLTLLLLSCADQTGPVRPVPGRFSLEPRFESSLAGIVPVARARFVLTRIPSGDVATDTVIDLPAGQDSVDLTLVAPMLNAAEAFTLRMTLITSAGDTVFRAGPAEVHPVTTGTAPAVGLTLVYVGVGANAMRVECLYDNVTVFTNDAVLMGAVARDSGDNPIPGTPVAWRSLDTTIARVPDRSVGSVVGVARGTARIVAQLLTGPADTALVTVSLPPASLLADSGSGQTAPAGSPLPQPLVARVVDAEGTGVPNQWVRFVVVAGGGSLSVDSALSDAAGRARALWTLGGVVGNQAVHATTPRLAGITASFTATSQSGGAGGITIVAGDGQTALVGTMLPVAPSVRVTDGQDNPVAGIPVTFAVSGGGGSVAGGSQVTDAAGLATVTGWTLGASVGINTLTVSADTLTPVQFTATATGPGGAMSMVLNGGNGQTTLARTTVPVAPSVLVRDGANNPVVGVAVSFSVVSGGGSLEVPQPTTNASGIAAAPWTLGAPGLNELAANLAGLPTVSFQATGTVGAPFAVAVVSGNTQTDTAGLPLPAPLVVEVRDSVGNPVSNIAVNWNTFHGSITPPTTASGADGRTQATWTLGVNTVNQTATASVPGRTPAVFTATAVFPNPTVLLALAGTDRVRLTDSAALDVTLSAPAPAGGALVTLSVDNRAVLDLATNQLLIAESQTTAQTRVYGLAAGTTTVRGTASGYAAGAAPVLVTVQVVSMPTTLNVPYGGTASLPIQISTPAPAGGVEVTLVSGNPSAVAVQTPSVTIPEGRQTANAILDGVTPGTATITASAAGFGVAQTAAATTARLNIVEGSTTFAQTHLDTLTVRLESNSVPVAAPSPGLAVTLTARNPDCVTAASPVTIPTGLVSRTFVTSYGGSATTPCSTWLVATAAGIEPDSASITINPPPGMTTYAWTMGAGLQRLEYAYLNSTNHGGVNVVIRPATANLVLLATDGASVGVADSIVVPVPAGQNYFQYYVNAREGVTDSDIAVQITYEAAGFTSGTSTTTIRRPAFDVYGLPTSTTTLSDSVVLYAYVGYTAPGSPSFSEHQYIRPGGQPAVVTVMNDTPAIGDLVKSGGVRGDTLTITVPVGAYYSPTTLATGGMAFDPDSPGSTTLSASLPGYDQTANYNRAITVSAPGMTTYAWTMGAGLQRLEYGYLGATNHGGRNVVIKTTTPGRVLLATNATDVGTDSIEVAVAQGQNYFQYYVNALEGVADAGDVAVQITYEAAGFTGGASTTTIRRPAFDVYGLPTNLTTFSDSVVLYAYVGYAAVGSPYFSEHQYIRPGGQPAVVTVTNGNPGVGDLVGSGGVRGDQLSVTVPVGAYYSPTTIAAGGIAFDPDVAGTTTIAAGLTGYDQLTNYNRTVTVSAPGITMYEWTVGAGLQKGAYGYLGATNHPGVNVTITSSAPGVALVSPDGTTPGTGSITNVFVPAGRNDFSFFVQGIEDTTGTIQVTARASGFTDGTAPLNVVTPGIGLNAVPGSLSAAGDSVAFYAQVGVPYSTNQSLAETQSVRAGGAPLTVTLTHSAFAVADLITKAAGRADAVTVTIPVGTYYSPTSVALDGAAIKGTVPGTTVVRGTIPNFITLLIEGQRTVTVTP